MSDFKNGDYVISNEPEKGRSVYATFHQRAIGKIIKLNGSATELELVATSHDSVSYIGYRSCVDISHFKKVEKYSDLTNVFIRNYVDNKITGEIPSTLLPLMVGDYVTHISGECAYGFTTRDTILEVLEVVSDQFLRVKVIGTSGDECDIGAPARVSTASFEKLESYEDLPSGIRKAAAVGKFYGTIPEKLIPFGVSEHLDKNGVDVNVGKYILGASKNLYKVKELLPYGKCKAEIYLGKVVDEVFTLSNFVVWNRWSPIYSIGDEVCVNGNAAKHIVTRVTVHQSGTTAESLKYQLFCKESGRTCYYKSIDISRYKKPKTSIPDIIPDSGGAYGMSLSDETKDSMARCKGKLRYKKSSSAETHTENRLFRKGFFAIIIASNLNKVLSEIVYVDKVTRFKDLPKELLTLSGKVFEKRSVSSYIPISEVPYAIGDLWLDPYDISTKVCTIKSIYYRRATSDVVLTYSESGVTRTKTLEKFNEFVADAKAKSNEIKNQSEKQGKKIMKTATKKVNPMQKMMDKMFKKVEGVVLDMTTGGVGVKRGESIYSLTTDVVEDKPEYCVGENMFEQLSFDIPAFAQSTPLTQVNEGDLVLSATGVPHGWAIKVNEKSLKVLKLDGAVTNVVPSKVLMMGAGQSVMVVKSLGGDQMGNMLPMLMLMEEKGSDGSSLDKMLPMMMMMGGMGATGGEAGAANPMANMMSNPMMMMAMMRDGDSEGLLDDPLMLMAMSGMMGGQQSGGMMGGMNPMMMMMLLKK